jgi:hypothetical protein
MTKDNKIENLCEYSDNCLNYDCSKTKMKDVPKNYIYYEGSENQNIGNGNLDYWAPNEDECPLQSCLISENSSNIV